MLCAIKNIDAKTHVFKCCENDEKLNNGIHCSKTNENHKMYWKDYNVTKSTHKGGVETIGGKGEILEVLPNGFLNTIKGNSFKQYDSNHYCIDFNTNGTLVGQIFKKQLVYKCCDHDEVLNDKEKCIKSNEIHENYWKDYHVIVRMISSYGAFIVGSENENISVLPSGDLLAKTISSTDTFVDHQYCIDFKEDGIKYALLVQIPSLGSITLLAVQIFLLFLGLVCLVSTAAIYLIVTDLRNYHGKALACHTFHLALAMAINASIRFFEKEPVLGFLKHLANFSHLSSYAWLMVMWLNVVCLSRYPKRYKMGSFAFIFTFLMVYAVCAMLILFKIKMWLRPFEIFQYDRRGEQI